MLGAARGRHFSPGVIVCAKESIFLLPEATYSSARWTTRKLAGKVEAAEWKRLP